jgi:hypothetical protein
VRPNFLIPLCLRTIVFVIIIVVIIVVIILIIILVIIFLLLFIPFDLAVASKDENVSFLKEKLRVQRDTSLIRPSRADVRHTTYGIRSMANL